MKVTNVSICGLEESIRASKYPMAVDICALNSDVTGTVQGLAGSAPGSGHDQFLTGIVVQFDLTFTLKAWTEMQRYHFIDFVSSQSTMHRIARFDIAAQCNEYVDPDIIAIVERMVAKYKADPSPENYLRILYNIPTGFMLTARMTTNYRQLKTIYHQRKNHRLPDWRGFCNWIETLPHNEFITGGC
jgi:hypothetical protein